MSLKSLRLYDRTEYLISLREKTQKPIIIKGDIKGNKLLMIVGRKTIFYVPKFEAPQYYIRDYLNYLKMHDFVVEEEIKGVLITRFKAKLKSTPNFDEKEICLRETISSEEIER